MGDDLRPPPNFPRQALRITGWQLNTSPARTNPLHRPHHPPYSARPLAFSPRGTRHLPRYACLLSFLVPRQSPQETPMNSFLRSAVLGSFCATALTLPSYSQNAGSDVPPVLDVHVHAMDESFPGGGPMCPNTSKFMASDPDTKEAPFGWGQEECTPKLYPAAKGEYLKDVAAEMERLNVTAVVFGDPKSRPEVEGRRCPAASSPAPVQRRMDRPASASRWMSFARTSPATASK